MKSESLEHALHLAIRERMKHNSKSAKYNISEWTDETDSVKLYQQVVCGHYSAARKNSIANAYLQMQDSSDDFTRQTIVKTRNKRIAFNRSGLDREERSVVVAPFNATEFYGQDLALRSVSDSDWVEFIDDQTVVAAISTFEESLCKDRKATSTRALHYIVASASANIALQEVGHVTNQLIGVASIAVSGLGFAVHNRRLSASAHVIHEAAKRGQVDTIKFAKHANMLSSNLKSNLDFIRSQMTSSRKPSEFWSAIKPLVWELAMLEHKFISAAHEDELLDTVPDEVERDRAIQRTREIRKQIYHIATQFH